MYDAEQARKAAIEKRRLLLSPAAIQSIMDKIFSTIRVYAGRGETYCHLNLVEYLPPPLKEGAMMRLSKKVIKEALTKLDYTISGTGGQFEISWNTPKS